MEIDRRLNLVLPIQTDRGTIFIHSMPISRPVFEQHWLVLSKAMAGIFSEGLSVVAGPGVAALMLKKLAQQMGVWDGPEGVERSLLPEIVRLSNVVMANPDGKSGWATIPLYDALAKGFISDEDKREAEDALVFFTLVSAVNKRAQVKGLLDSAGGLWGFQTTLQSCTDMAASLPTSTADENSTAKMPA